MSYFEQLEALEKTLLTFPSNLLRAALAVDIVAAMVAVSERHNLILREVGDIYDEIAGALQGKPSDLAGRLREILEPDRKTKAAEIARDIEQGIIEKIRTIAAGKEPTPRAEEEKPERTPIPLRKIDAAAPTPETPVAPAPAPAGGGIPALLAIARGSAYRQEEIEAAYRKVPEEVKRAVTSVDVARRLEEIGKKFGLRVDELGALGSEAGLLMIGLTHPKDFVEKLGKRLRMTDERARTIGSEVNEQVFRPIRESLKRMYAGEEIGGGEEETPAGSFAAAPKARFVDVRGGTESIADGKLEEGGPPSRVAPAALRPSFGEVLEEEPSREEILRGIEEPETLPRAAPEEEKRAEPEAALLFTEPPTPPTTPAPVGMLPPRPAVVEPPMQELKKAPAFAGALPKAPIGAGSPDTRAPSPSQGEKLSWEERKRRIFGENALAAREPAEAPAAKPAAASAARKAGNIVEEKLSQPVGIPREETRYESADPYREATE